ncbi:MAG: enoyl-CoA hydratase/isomerase family protein, partial [Candidatus Aenigmatarchaeota archaeon]
MASDYEDLNLEKEEKIATVTLNRPDKLNAISPGLLQELDDVIEELWNDDDINVIIFRGAGGNFSSGADLEEQTGKMEDIRRGQRTFEKLKVIPKIVVAATEGYVLGGGLELASACDLRVAKEDAQFDFPEPGLGIIPGWGGTQRVPKLIGISKAMELCLTPDKIDAEEAERHGLVSRVYSEDEFEDKLEEFAQELAEVPPSSAKILKRAVNKGGEVPSDVGLELENFGLM